MKKLYAAVMLSMTALTGAMGQAALTNAGTITVQGTGYIYVNGDVQINSTGAITNDGTIEVLGNWQNDRTDGAISNGASGERLVKFTNTSIEQTIASTSGKNAFYNLESQIPVAIIAGTPTGLHAANDVTVVNNMNFNGGGIIMMDKNLTIGSAGSVSNGSSLNYAYFSTGSFRKKLVAGSSTSTLHTFPFYRESIGYIPAKIRLNTVPIQGDEVRVSFFPVTNIGTVAYVGQCNLPGYPGNQIMLNKMIDNFGYWQVDVVDPSQTNLDNVAGWNYDITLSPTTGALAAMGSDYLKLLKLTSHSGQTLLPALNSSTSWTGAIANSGSYCNGIGLVSGYSVNTGITATNLTSFSRFSGAGNSGGAGLPITLVSLGATPVDNKYIAVEWVTATEINNAGFEVERSVDGEAFEKIGWVDGHGNSSTQLAYSLTDNDVASNVLYYYRLKQVDMNQEFQYSNIVTAGIKAENVLTVSDFVPNPTNNNSRIEIVSGEVKKASIVLYNTLGQMIQNEEFSINTGKNTYQFDVNQLASGTYYAQINIEGKMFDKKLVVNK